MNEVLQDLIQQLAFHDHENDTDTANEVLSVVTRIRKNRLSRQEAADLSRFTFMTMQENSIFSDSEHERIAGEVFRELPAALFD